MRKTLHDYTIEQWEGVDILDDFAGSCQKCYKYAKLTNRQPMLGDFIPCDENGEVLEKPDIHSLDHSIAVALNHEYQQALDRVIFKGDWEVKISLDGRLIALFSNGKKFDSYDMKRQEFCFYKNRIEDLPREIEFKEVLI